MPEMQEEMLWVDERARGAVCGKIGDSDEEKQEMSAPLSPHKQHIVAQTPTENLLSTQVRWHESRILALVGLRRVGCFLSLTHMDQGSSGHQSPWISTHAANKFWA